MTQVELQDIAVGTEVSVLHEGRRRQGWVAEKEKGAIIRLYPESGSEDFEIENPSQLQVLQDQTVPQGWNSVDLEKEDGAAWVSLRFDDFFWQNLHSQAAANGKTPEQQLMDYLMGGVARSESEDV